MNSRVVPISAALTILLLISSVGLLQKVDRVRSDATLQEVLYIPSPQTVQRLSLGYGGLLADIYWTRVVQYFGGKHHVRSQEYRLLAPLLDITTTLDPHLVVAYEFGSIFLAQSPPEGAGDPKAAERLVERGIQANPEAWRLYYHLGFIQWQELHDPLKASETFRRGSEVPGALPWMQVMAAGLAQSGGDEQTARTLWTNILQDTTDSMIRNNAVKRLRALDSDHAVETLQAYVDAYTKRFGHVPRTWGEMMEVGFMRGVPHDPMGAPYALRNGRVEVEDLDALPFITKGLPPGREASVLPRLQSK